MSLLFMEYPCKVDKVYIKDDDVYMSILVNQRGMGVSGIKLNRYTVTSDYAEEYVFGKDIENQDMWEVKLGKVKTIIDGSKRCVAEI